MVSKVKLSENGPEVSNIVSGVMNWGSWGSDLSARDMRSLIDKSIDLGITTFDHADIYGDYTTEATFGKALSLTPGDRDRIQLISKCGIRLVTPNRPKHKLKSYDTSKEHIVASVDRSLLNLRTDYLDLLLIHRPDPLMDVEEVADAFSHLKGSGKVLHFGVSNFKIPEMQLLARHFPLCTNQIEFSLSVHRELERGLLEYMKGERLRPMAWSPLGGGELLREKPPKDQRRAHTLLRKMADAYHCSPDQLLLSWILRHPSGVVPVIGTSKAERMALATQALSLKLSREDWFALLEAVSGDEVA